MSAEVAAHTVEPITTSPDLLIFGQFANVAQKHGPDGAPPKTDPESASSLRLQAVSRISDEHLLAQVRDGIKDALGLLFRRHARAVRAIAGRVLCSETEAEDLVQDVFLFIFRKASLFDPTLGTGLSWIIQITYHRALDRRRYLNARKFYTVLNVDDSSLHLADANASRAFDQRSLHEVFGQELADKLHSCLSPEQQNTIQLYFFEGHTLREIAERTGQSLANVRSHYYRGLERLRRYVLAENLPPK